MEGKSNVDNFAFRLLAFYKFVCAKFFALVPIPSAERVEKVKVKVIGFQLFSCSINILSISSGVSAIQMGSFVASIKFLRG